MSSCLLTLFPALGGSRDSREKGLLNECSLSQRAVQVKEANSGNDI